MGIGESFLRLSVVMLWVKRFRQLRTVVIAVLLAFLVLMIMVVITSRARKMYRPEQLQSWYQYITEKNDE